MKAPTPVRPRQPGERLTKLEDRVTRVEDEARSHRLDDTGSFTELRSDIAKLGIDLGRRIDEMGGQVSVLTRDKERAEGRAEGIASVKAAMATPKWWHPYVKWVITTVVGGLVTGCVALTITVFHMEQDKLEAALKREAPATSVTVSPSPVAQPIPGQPAPPASLPPSQLSDPASG